jgi:hypothetical protein
MIVASLLTHASLFLQRLAHLEDDASNEKLRRNLRRKLDNGIEALDKSLLSPPPPSVCAFVTFENDEGKDFALKFFKDKANRSANLFRSTYRLKVDRAKEPDDIFFENLEKTPR